VGQLFGDIDFKPDQLAFFVFHGPGHESVHADPDDTPSGDLLDGAFSGQLALQRAGGGADAKYGEHGGQKGGPENQSTLSHGLAP